MVQGGFARKRSKFQIFTFERAVGVLRKLGLGSFIKRMSPETINAAKRFLPATIDYSESKCWGVHGAPAISISNKHVVDEMTDEVFKKALTDYLYSIKDENNGEKIIEKVVVSANSCTSSIRVFMSIG